MSSSEIRERPPSSVATWEEVDKYKTLYDDITNNGVILQYHHRHALGELACMLVEMEGLRRSLRDDGEAMKVNGDKGNTVTKRNPARDALDKLRTQSFRLMKEFKMTPASQGRTLGIPGDDGGMGDGFDGI